MSEPDFPIDADAIRALARLLDETALTEIEVEEGGRKLRVARGRPAAMAPPDAVPSGPAAEPGAAEAEAGQRGAVTSPMVGTVYLAPEPGAAPHVKLGDEVSQGDTLVIIEAMKVMNPIRAPHGGRVSSILVEDGSPVEYGQALMIVD